jgi:hypothetical protein
MYVSEVNHQTLYTIFWEGDQMNGGGSSHFYAKGDDVHREGDCHRVAQMLQEGTAQAFVDLLNWDDPHPQLAFSQSEKNPRLVHCDDVTTGAPEHRFHFAADSTAYAQELLSLLNSLQFIGVAASEQFATAG